MSIEKLIQMPKQSIDFLEKKVRKRYQFLKSIKMNSPIMTTDQYNAIYPYVAHELYQELMFTHHHTTLIHLDKDKCMEVSTDKHISLNGFYIAEHQTAKVHLFVFTYEGTWLYNDEPLTIPKRIQEYISRLIGNSYECLLYNKPLTKENLHMNNIERLQMEIGGIELPHEELLIYMSEEGIDGYQSYNASSKANKKAIYNSALSILNSVANQPHAMKNYKQDDMTIQGFAQYLQARIDQLEKKVRQMPNDDSTGSNFFNLFT